MKFSRGMILPRLFPNIAFLKPIAASLLLGALLLSLSASAHAQKLLTEEGGGQALTALTRMQSNSTAPTPHNADGTPDLSGLWGPDKNFMYDITSALKPGETLPLQEWAAKAAKEHMSKDDPNVRCRPSGIPRMTPYPWKIVQTPKLVIFLYEGGTHGYRQIFLDGRSHSKDLDPTYYGESIGHWEGDALVVDTIGFNDVFWFDGAGHPHTEKLHIIERVRRPDMGHLTMDVTIDDPGAYTKPFTVYGHMAQLVNTEIMEYICDENNVDLPHIVGKDSRK
jgi:hypothetical protein